jgi:transposase-like protein
MEYYQKISGLKCKHTDLKKAGRSTHGVQRYRCLNSDCTTHTFMLEYRYKAYEPGLKKKVLEMSFNACGIREIKRVLKLAKSPIIRMIN